MKLIAKKLNEQETHKTKHFLYHIYAKHLGWVPQEDNLSGWVVKHDEDGPFFEDIFNWNAAWFAVYNAGKIVATGRLIRPVDGKLEMELYNRLPDNVLSAGCQRVEMNRLAVDPEFNGSPALGLLFREMLMYAKAAKIDFIMTGAPKSTIGIVDDLLFEKLNTFRYSESDSDPVYCSMLDMGRTSEVDKLLKALPYKRYTLSFF